MNVHDVTINDEMFNPLYAHPNKFSFVTFENFATIDKTELEEDSDDAFQIEFGMQLSGLKRIESRTRYTVWDILGDVGGLSDGLHMITATFMSIYASLAFEASYLHGKKVDDPLKRNRYQE